MIFIKPKNSPCEKCKKIPVIGKIYNSKIGEYEWVCNECYN